MSARIPRRRILHSHLGSALECDRIALEDLHFKVQAVFKGKIQWPLKQTSRFRR